MCGLTPDASPTPALKPGDSGQRWQGSGHFGTLEQPPPGRGRDRGSEGRVTGQMRGFDSDVEAGWVPEQTRSQFPVMLSWGL